LQFIINYTFSNRYKDFAREHLADYKLPESITFIDALPKGATGKIDRKLLKQYDKS